MNEIKTLECLFIEGLQEVCTIAPHPMLAIRSASLKRTLRFIEETPEAAYVETVARKHVSQRNWAIDERAIQELLQVIGEAQFWMLAKQADVTLERVVEADDCQPDFRLASSTPLRFEVKTISVVGGEMGLLKMSEESFKARGHLQDQIDNGNHVAITEVEVAPHGTLPNRSAIHLSVCQRLIDKARQNIKLGQYAAAPTLLVLNLMLIDGNWSGNADLRPIASGFPQTWSVHTGALWTLGFGFLQQRIHGTPEFEGKPGIEGELGRAGILADPDFDSINGMLFVIHSMQDEPRLYGLLRSRERSAWEEFHPIFLETFYSLVGSNWNDELDSNGFALTEYQ